MIFYLSIMRAIPHFKDIEQGEGIALCQFGIQKTLLIIWGAASAYERKRIPTVYWTH